MTTPTTPSFVNQRSRLGTLSSRMALFSNQIQRDSQDLRNGVTDASSDQQKASDMSKKFIQSQKKRMKQVEEDFLNATEDLLPASECLTVTELASLCAAFQKTNVEQMIRLEEILSQYGYNAPLHERWDDTLPAIDRQSYPDVQASYATTPALNDSLLVGEPLEQVLEAEYESDATTTPSSSVFAPSPTLASASSFSSRKATPHRRDSLEPPSTASVLKETRRMSMDAVERWRMQNDRRSLERVATDQFNESVPIHVNRTSMTLSDNPLSPETSSPHTEPEQTDHTVQAAANTNDESQRQKEQDVNLSITYSDPSETQATNSINEGLLGLNFSGSQEELLLDDTLYDDGVSVCTKSTLVRRSSLSQKQDTHLAQGGHANVYSINDHSVKEDLRATVKDDMSSGESTESSEGATDDSDGQQTNETYDDASLLTVATLVGRGRLRDHASETQNLTVGLAEHYSAQSPGASRVVDETSHRVDEIIVSENQALSPCSVDSDQQYGTSNDTIGSPPRSPPVQENSKNDASLLVTPVLDRYRLVADDSSIGIKVVPNTRSAHRHRRGKNRAPTESDGSSAEGSSEKLVTSAEKSRLHREKPLGPSVPVNQRTPNKHHSERIRKVYRKTPHVKKLGLLKPIDENTSPYDSPMSEPSPISADDRALHSPFEADFPPTQQEAAPTARSLSLQFSRLETTPNKSATRHSEGNIGSSLPRTPVTSAWIAKHLPKETEGMKDSIGVDSHSTSLSPIAPVGTPLQSAATSQSPLDITSSNGSKASRASLTNSPARLSKISLAEHESAPKVVRMLVSLDEVNTAVELLNGSLRDTRITGDEQILSQSEAHDILASHFTDRKQKSILLSLCHWRRLTMLKPNEQGKVFAISY